MSNIVQEAQNQVPPFNAADDRVVSSTYDGVGNKLTCTYPGQGPGTGRVITTTYDVLDRKESINDTIGAPQLIATYDYIGPGRVERRDYGNGTRTEYAYDGILPNPPNDFGVRMIVRTRHTVIGSACTTDADCPTGATCECPNPLDLVPCPAPGVCIIDDRTVTWDRMGNKTRRKDVRANGPGLTHDYTYDSIYRLVRTVVTDPVAVVVRDQRYDLDGVGNRTTVTGGPDPGAYTMDPTTPEPADRQLNQYTTTPPDARQYDKNGNLTVMDEPPVGAPALRAVLYDYRNQMVEYVDHSVGAPPPGVHRYAYDALGRRIRKTVDATGVAGGPTETRFYLDGWQEIEEQDGAGTTVATYTFGLYIDEVLTMRRDVDADLTAEDYFYHSDDLYNVTAVSDASGVAVERHDYADYGQPLDPVTLVPLISSSISNPLLFTGRRYDPETSLYDYRTRYLDHEVVANLV